jgi:hypothetical protein
MEETLLVLIVPLALDGLAVQVVLDNVGGSHNPRRDVTCDVKTIRIRPAPDAHVSKSVQNTQLLRRQHAVGEHQIVDQRFFGLSV